MSGAFQPIPTLTGVVQTTGNQNIAGIKTFIDQTPTTSSINASAIFDGGVGINGNCYINSFLSSQGQKHSIISKNANYGASHLDEIILADATFGSITITLPLAATASGNNYIIKKIDTYATSVIVSANGGQTIEGSSTVTLSTQYAFVRVFSNGSTWFKY
jgi:hypothetical protein